MHDNSDGHDEVAHAMQGHEPIEQALHRSEERLLLATEAAELGVYDYDIVDDTVAWDERMRGIWGVAADEPITHEVFMAGIHPDDRTATRQAVERALDPQGDGRYRAEYRVINRIDGVERWVAASGRVYFDSGRAVRLVGLARDVSERKQAELLAAEREARYRTVIETSADGFWMLDQEGRILSINDAYLRRSGYSRAEALGMRVVDFEAQESAAEVLAHIQKVRRDGSDCFETRHRTKDGEIWPVEINAAYSPEAGGRFFCFSRDITERKRAEAKILDLNAELERRVIERTAQLQAANGELDAFAYSISHDLRGPLRALSGFSQALLEDYGERLDEEGKDYLHKIALAAQRMNAMVDGLLALSRGSRNEMQPTVVDVSAVARRLLDELARGEPQRPLRVEVQEGLYAWGDASMIETVLDNLLGNAWKYSARTPQPLVRVYREERDGRRWICVADNGAGFDMADAGKLFQAFQRLHSQREFAGTGIGLATVRRIVQRHGGAVDARGEPDAGATFCISLPEGPADEH